MGIFSNIFRKKEIEKKELDNIKQWKKITSLAHFHEAIAASQGTYVGIFKHSTTCAISNNVLKRFASKMTADKNIELYYLDLLSYRDISNKISEELGVIHQSPQFIVLRNKKVVVHASHYNILGLDV